MPPYAYILYKRCKDYKCLPEEGGLLDQNESIFQQMEAAKLGYLRWEASLVPKEVEDGPE